MDGCNLKLGPLWKRGNAIDPSHLIVGFQRLSFRGVWPLLLADSRRLSPKLSWSEGLKPSLNDKTKCVVPTRIPSHEPMNHQKVSDKIGRINCLPAFSEKKHISPFQATWLNWSQLKPHKNPSIQLINIWRFPEGIRTGKGMEHRRPKGKS